MSALATCLPDPTRDPVFDLEDSRSRLLSDARQWIEVYGELVSGIEYITRSAPDAASRLADRCEDYRRRLDFWRRRAAELSTIAG